MKNGNVEILLGDCMDIMKNYPDGYFDLAIVDPPYGGNDAINLSNCKNKNKQKAQRTKYKQFKNLAPTKEYFEELKRTSKNQVVWGVNFYKNFDLSGGRIVWDKKGTCFGRAEIAYYSNSKSVNVFEYTWNGMIHGDMKNKENRIHPTQKPVALYDWIYKNYVTKDMKILDTHLGSGSNAITAHYFGVKEFVGIELDEDYFCAACKRFEEQTMQLKLF